MLSEKHILKPFERQVLDFPNKILFTYVDDKGKNKTVRTAQELWDKSAKLARYLSEGCGLQKGDVVLLIYPPSIEFIESYTACLLAGIVPAPVYPPNVARSQEDLAKLSAIAKVSGAKAMLTNRVYRLATKAQSIKSSFAKSRAQWPKLPWVVTQGLGWFSSKKLDFSEVQPSDLAILQFTSGSTSTPKGVRLTHANLEHQLLFNSEALNLRSDSRLAMWVPQYHDLGLISGITSTLRGHGSMWFMSPFSFLKKPSVWFDVVHRVRATHTASPNFGFELMTRKCSEEDTKRWDLSCLKVVMSAAEPIMPRTVDRFLKKFASCGLSPRSFCPAYGLAEHTVGVTMGGQSRLLLDRETLVTQNLAYESEYGDLELVGCGKAPSDVKVRIVETRSLKVLPDSQSGEIWVQSKSVADGYQGLAKETHETFGATLPGEPGTFLRTGDVGFLRKGELYISGRGKDLIIVRGRNIHPEDVEESVRHSHKDIRKGGVVAFSLQEDATELLAVLVEIKEKAQSCASEILLAVRKCINEHWHVQAKIILLPSRSVIKTTSGKIRREACKVAYENHEFKGLIEAKNQETKQVKPHNKALKISDLRLCAPEDRMDILVDGICVEVAQLVALEASQIKADDFLSELGLDSLSSSELLAVLEEQVGRSLPTTLLVEHPTPASLANRVLQELGLEFVASVSAKSQVVESMPFRPEGRPMLPATTRIAIAGGGVGGLVSALELAKLGYKDITLFEKDETCGGKVCTVFHEGEIIELGQNFFGAIFREPIGLATDLGIEIEMGEKEFLQWEEGFGFEEGLARMPGLKWMRSVLKAAKADAQSSLPFPSMLPELEENFGQFLQRHRLGGTPHRSFLFDWNAMGYGYDLDVPAAYVVSYLQVTAHMGSICHLPGGNQKLWHALAKSLESDWGVCIKRNTAITGLEVLESGVRILYAGKQECFDEFISALPPKPLKAILPKSDPLHQWLDELYSYGYAVRSYKASGLPEKAGVFLPETATELGKTMLLQGCHSQKGWSVGGQYSAEPSKDLKHLDDAFLKEEIRETVKKMGGEVSEFGPAKTWDYFPHFRKAPGSKMREVEKLQGKRHIWTTGSWVSFETTEHVARHAKHLINTCFDPSR